MKKQAILTMVAMTGLFWAGGALANDCYCPQGHLAGDSCLVPVPNATGGGYSMQPALKAICPNNAPPQTQNQKLPNVTWEAIGGWIELRKKPQVDVAFNAKTGTYGVLVSTDESQSKERIFIDKKYTRLHCVSKETGIPLQVLKSDSAKRAGQFNNACKAIFTTKTLGNHLSLWRGKRPNGKWQAYWLEHASEKTPEILQQINNIQTKCEETSQCEFIGEFGAELGAF